MKENKRGDLMSKETSKVIMNYRGHVFVSVESGQGDTEYAYGRALLLYNKLKADYDHENKVSCLECAKENNIKPPEGPQKPKKGINNEIQAVA